MYVCSSARAHSLMCQRCNKGNPGKGTVGYLQNCTPRRGNNTPTANLETEFNRTAFLAFLFFFLRRVKNEGNRGNPPPPFPAFAPCVLRHHACYTLPNVNRIPRNAFPGRRRARTAINKPHCSDVVPDCSRYESRGRGGEPRVNASSLLMSGTKVPFGGSTLRNARK